MHKCKHGEAKRNDIVGAAESGIVKQSEGRSHFSLLFYF